MNGSIWYIELGNRKAGLPTSLGGLALGLTVAGAGWLFEESRKIG